MTGYSKKVSSPKVSIGLLSHNEELRIKRTLDAIGQQTILAGRGPDVEWVIVANNCQDRTAEMARHFIAEHELEGVARVYEVAEKGKTNAWNRFVRDFAHPDSEIFLLIDSDVRFLTPDTLEKLAAGIRDNPDVMIAHGDQVKHLTITKPKNPLEWFSAAYSRLNYKVGQHMISGQLYAIRANIARRVHLPVGLVCDDGYLKQLVSTHGFTQPMDLGRLQHIRGIGNIYMGYRKPKDILVTQVRMRIGEVQVYVLIQDVKRKLRENPDLPIEEFHDEDHPNGPQWLKNLLDKRVREGGFWVMQPGALTHRLARLGRLRLWDRVRSFPLALIGTCADVVLCLLANRKLKREGGQGEALWTVIRDADQEPELE